MWKNKLFNYFAREAMDREVPLALHPTYVNERVHYKLLTLLNEGVSEYMKATIYKFFPISEIEGLSTHLLKAKCSVLAAEEDCKWHDLIVTVAEQKNVVRARRNFLPFIELTCTLFGSVKFVDIDEYMFNLLTNSF
jgi:hypothetical protein